MPQQAMTQWHARRGDHNAASGFNITRSGCTAGTTCVDLREYTPATFTGTAKPIINNATGADRTLFSINGNRGGVRFLNLKLAGDNGALGNHNNGLFFYNGAHDVTLGNLDVDNFDLAVHNAGGNSGVQTTTNIKLTGNMFTNNRTFGFLGSGSMPTSPITTGTEAAVPPCLTMRSTWEGAVPVTNIQVVGNYVRGQYGPTCHGRPDCCSCGGRRSAGFE